MGCHLFLSLQRGKFSSPQSPYTHLNWNNPPLPSPRLEHLQRVSMILDHMTHQQIFFPPLRHSCFKSHYGAYERKAIKASTSLLFPLTSLMRNIFQPNPNACFYFPLIAFKWILWSGGKRIRFVFCFFTLKSARSHDADYSISLTHTAPVLSICLILWQLLPFSPRTLLHQGLWAFQGKQCCHSSSYSLIYITSDSIVVPGWWLPLIENLIYLKVSQWHLEARTEVE